MFCITQVRVGWTLWLFEGNICLPLFGWPLWGTHVVTFKDPDREYNNSHHVNVDCMVTLKVNIFLPSINGMIFQADHASVGS